MKFKMALFGALASIVSCGCAEPLAKPEFTGARSIEALVESCKQCPSDRELAKAARTEAQRDFLRRMNALEWALTGRPLLGGNRVELLLDGPMTHEAQLTAIRRARHHVHLITYIMTDDVLANRYLDALRERSKAGVKVRFMFDALGSRTVSSEFREELAAAKIEVRAYGAIDPREREQPRWSHRHHRKILVVDGRVAFTGGINISDEYRQSSAPASGAKSRGKKKPPAPEEDTAPGTGAAGGWRDTHVQIEGPAVAQFQQLFFESWELGHEPIPREAAYWPKLRERGPDFVRAIMQQGNDLHELVLDPVTQLWKPADEKRRDRAIYGSYLAAISQARARIWITQAYFIPNQEFLDLLVDAAKRGVDVRLLVPSTSDIKLMVQASRFHYAPLLEAGARIFEYQGPMLHAKTAVVDGVWATVGSSNIDYRSFVHNDEANAIIMGHDFGAKMERMFHADVANAREITRQEWARRSWTERLRQRSAVLLKYWI